MEHAPVYQVPPDKKRSTKKLPFLLEWKNKFRHGMKDLTGLEMKVAFGLFSFANTQTGETKPSVKTLAEMSGQENPQRVRDALKRLEELGWCTVLEFRGGRHRPNLRKLTIPREETGTDGVPVCDEETGTESVPESIAKQVRTAYPFATKKQVPICKRPVPICQKTGTYVVPPTLNSTLNSTPNNTTTSDDLDDPEDVVDVPRYLLDEETNEETEAESLLREEQLGAMDQLTHREIWPSTCKEILRAMPELTGDMVIEIDRALPEKRGTGLLVKAITQRGPVLIQKAKGKQRVAAAKAKWQAEEAELRTKAEALKAQAAKVA